MSYIGKVMFSQFISIPQNGLYVKINCYRNIFEGEAIVAESKVNSVEVCSSAYEHESPHLGPKIFINR